MTDEASPDVAEDGDQVESDGAAHPPLSIEGELQVALGSRAK